MANYLYATAAAGALYAKAIKDNERIAGTGEVQTGQEGRFQHGYSSDIAACGGQRRFIAYPGE